jgi:hypothetical protein
MPGRDSTRVEINTQPRRPVEDPTLGIPVEVTRTGTPRNRLVSIGDSLTHGFMSAAIFRTDLSWPAVVAYELGLQYGSEFRFPLYEPPAGPGGLPLDLERLARAFQARFGHSLGWAEIVPAAHWVRRYMDAIEDWWEREEGLALIERRPPPECRPFHNLAVYGWDLLDVQVLDADRVRKRMGSPRDNLVKQTVEDDNDRAALVVLESCRTPEGKARTVLDAIRALGDEGTDCDDGAGIETLVVMLGANNALGAVVRLDPRWTPDDYLEQTPLQRLAGKGRYNVWQPPHFAAELESLVRSLRAVNARHVILATVPQVTIAPIARGVKGKVRLGSRYFPYYTRPWIADEDFNPRHDPHITEDQARKIDSAIDAYNEAIIEAVRRARTDGLDWYVFDLGALLDRLAVRRYLEDPAARPDWWTPYPLPEELKALDPVPNTRFFRSGPEGRTDGGLFSLDGVHPTTSAYGVVAQEIITIMSTAGVVFRGRDGAPRTDGPIQVDMKRVLASDSLLTHPPIAVTSTLSLLGWLDESLDWVNRVLPYR